MNFNGFDENKADTFSEKPLKEKLNDEVPASNEPVISKSEAENDGFSFKSSEDTYKERTFDNKAEETEPTSHADEYKRYRQYSDYSSKMNLHQPVDAAFRQRYYNPEDYAATQSKSSRPQKKRKKGLIVSIMIVCVIFTFVLGGISVYALLSSPLARVIGVGITNVFDENHSLLPDTIGDVVTPPSTGDNGGVDNPPSFDIISVAPSKLEKVYDSSGREILSAANIYELVSPSVVSITTKTASDNGLGYSSSGGSGIVFSSDGYIITNAHVVDGVTTISVSLPSDPETLYTGTVIGSDSKADIAVLKIDAVGLPVAEFGDSDMLKIGDMAVAIGNPTSLDLHGATTQGIISGLNREIQVDESGRVLTLIQTDAAINPGNSGGPLLNCYGQVIGINTIGLKSVNYEGLNFAIPSNTLKPIVEELLEFGYVKGYPRIGITGDSVSVFQAQMYGVPLGVIVSSVEEKSDAFKKGIQPYDIITHVNNKSVMSIADINTIKNTMKVGDTIKLTVYRDGKSNDFDIVLVDEIDLK